MSGGEPYSHQAEPYSHPTERYSHQSTERYSHPATRQYLTTSSSATVKRFQTWLPPWCSVNGKTTAARRVSTGCGSMGCVSTGRVSTGRVSTLGRVSTSRRVSTGREYTRACEYAGTCEYGRERHSQNTFKTGRFALSTVRAPSIWIIDTGASHTCTMALEAGSRSTPDYRTPST